MSNKEEQVTGWGLTHGSKAINSLGTFIGEAASMYDKQGAGYAEKIIGGGMSGFEFARQVANGGKMDATFNKMFREGGEAAGKLRAGKLALAAAGTMGVMRAAAGAVRGAFTDGQGNIDLPGIPFF